jgi:beta-glucosidase
MRSKSFLSFGYSTCMQVSILMNGLFHGLSKSSARTLVICMAIVGSCAFSQVAIPKFSPDGGPCAVPLSISITSTTSGASIRYTIDGSTPSDVNGLIYSAPVTINASTVVKAIAYQTGLTSSTVAWATYTTNQYITQAIAVVNLMSLTEKISQVHGSSDPTSYRYIPGSTNAPTYYFTNGPAGQTAVNWAGKGHGGPATALPAPIALAATFDTNMAHLYGTIVGKEAVAYSNAMIEGPDLNIARVPQNGRTFEAYGEDPYLVGQIASADIIGIQEQGVNAESKHFACNNQETKRMSINTIIDERTLREIYLPAFETTVKQGKVDAVMSAYNKLNGYYCTENMVLLHDILKGEWGFTGYITSDFGATHSTVASAMAGLDAEMPTATFFGSALQSAIPSQVPLNVLDNMLIRRFSKMMERGTFHAPLPNQTIPTQANGAIARRIAANAMVLLKNDRQLLPLDTAKLHSIALIGPSATSAKTGGGGSSNVTAAYTVAPLAGLQARAGTKVTVTLNNGSDTSAAASLARSSDVAIVMVGDNQSEGSDPSISLSGTQNALVRAVAYANPNTIVVLKTGTAALMPWVNQVPAILESWYPGEEDGNAVADVLFGDVNPSGKLPLTFPANVSDQPGQVSTGSSVTYTEGVFVGYRHYDAHNVVPLFPFGHGLSYTTFQYQNLSVLPSSASFATNPAQTISVDVDISNSGGVAGSEAVQVYVGMPSTTSVAQPPKQLKGFQKVQLLPSETGHIHVDLNSRAFAYWDTVSHSWMVAAGTYPILVGSSSRDIRLQGQVTIAGSTSVNSSNATQSLPVAFRLEQNYPNPFNPTTKIRFSVPEDGFVSLKVYNVLGQVVATLFEGPAKSGHYISVTFDATANASGVYFSRLEYNGRSIVQRMLFTK